MVSNNNQYNWKIEHSRVINCDIEKVWEVISMRSNLEAFHPFCKSNRVIEWPGKGAVDEIEYLNGLTLERNFIDWMDKTGYDLYIFQAGRPASHVSWRIVKKDDKTNISIIISPYLFNQTTCQHQLKVVTYLTNFGRCFIHRVQLRRDRKYFHPISLYKGS